MGKGLIEERKGGGEKVFVRKERWGKGLKRKEGEGGEGIFVKKGRWGEVECI